MCVDMVSVEGSVSSGRREGGGEGEVSLPPQERKRGGRSRKSKKKIRSVVRLAEVYTNSSCTCTCTCIHVYTVLALSMYMYACSPHSSRLNFSAPCVTWWRGLWTWRWGVWRCPAEPSCPPWLSSVSAVCTGRNSVS